MMRIKRMDSVFLYLKLLTRLLHWKISTKNCKLIFQALRSHHMDVLISGLNRESFCSMPLFLFSMSLIIISSNLLARLHLIWCLIKLTLIFLSTVRYTVDKDMFHWSTIPKFEEFRIHFIFVTNFFRNSTLLLGEYGVGRVDLGVWNRV